LGQSGESNSGVQSAAAEPTDVIKYHIRTKKMGMQSSSTAYSTWYHYMIEEHIQTVFFFSCKDLYMK
jgi:hypothetical protein